MLKDIVKKLLKRSLDKIAERGYFKLYDKMLLNCPDLDKVSDGEEQWLEKWRRYYPNLSPLSYRIFSKYIGAEINIVPLELIPTIIEPVLNPGQFRPFYSDKNSLDKILPSQFTPTVYVRNVNGVFYDGNYKPLSTKIDDAYISTISADKVVLKPTLSSSGKGVKIYSRKGDVFLDKSQQILTLEYLNKAYKSNYLISEFFHQSDFMQKFNQSSVNTIRMATYRDRKGCVHVLRTIVRMGGKNAEVDNAHAGGVFCGVDEDGNLGNYVCDWLGNTGKIHNGIDFSKEKLQIPGFEAVKEFAIETHKYIIHHDLLALDIVLDKCNRPQLLEINCEGFGGWVFQFTCGSMFAQYTDEIIEYCDSVRDNVSVGLLKRFGG